MWRVGAEVEAGVPGAGAEEKQDFRYVLKDFHSGLNAVRHQRVKVDSRVWA